LDEALKHWKHRNTPLSEEDFILKIEEITKPNDVPNSHTWLF